MVAWDKVATKSGGPKMWTTFVICVVAHDTMTKTTPANLYYTSPWSNDLKACWDVANTVKPCDGKAIVNARMTITWQVCCCIPHNYLNLNYYIYNTPHNFPDRCIRQPCVEGLDWTLRSTWWPRDTDSYGFLAMFRRISCFQPETQRRCKLMSGWVDKSFLAPSSALRPGQHYDMDADSKWNVCAVTTQVFWICHKIRT